VARISSIVEKTAVAKACSMPQEWVLNIKLQCDEQCSGFFFKQWGGCGVNGKKRAKKENGRLLQGRTWDAVTLLTENSQNQSLTMLFDR